ncbi:hypothetical protein MTO96_038296 [Rhipicephalus appendiculatus]
MTKPPSSNDNGLAVLPSSLNTAAVDVTYTNVKLATRGVLLRRCPCGQVVNTNDASQSLGWKVRRDVSIQCGLQQMAPLPLLVEIFPSAGTVKSIETGTSCNQAGSLSRVSAKFENGMEHGTGSSQHLES